jgi:spore photoproduct lyase
MPSRSIPDLDLAAESSTQRFSLGSKKALHERYPGTNSDEGPRRTTRFKTIKYVYAPDVMKEMRAFLDGTIGKHLPATRTLYRT